MEFSPEEMDHLNNNSLYKTVGIFIDEAEDGKARSHLRPNPALCWPFKRQPHGGVLFTLIDTTMACAVLTAIDKEYNCATINLDIQYIKRAKGETFTCQAWVTHRGKNIIYTRADIVDEKNQLLSTGQGAFSVVKGSL